MATGISRRRRAARGRDDPRRASLLEPGDASCSSSRPTRIAVGNPISGWRPRRSRRRRPGLADFTDPLDVLAVVLVADLHLDAHHPLAEVPLEGREHLLVRSCRASRRPNRSRERSPGGRPEACKREGRHPPLDVPERQVDRRHGLGERPTRPTVWSRRYILFHSRSLSRASSPTRSGAKSSRSTQRVAVSPPRRLQEYPIPRTPSSVVTNTTGMLMWLTGPPFFPLDDPDCIGRGSGMRSSSALTSAIRVFIASPFPKRKAPPPAGEGPPFEPVLRCGYFFTRPSSS
jgi:hypothetical protein